MSVELATAAPASRLDILISLVENSVTSPNSRRAYRACLLEFLSWMAAAGKPMSKATVNEWRSTLTARGLAPSTVNLALAAIKKLAQEAADNRMLPQDVAAAVNRVAGVKRIGTRSGNWLSLDQAEALLAAPNTETVRGVRDRALLAVLVGCGLRRDEAARLRHSHIQQRDGRWVAVDLVGKGGRVRTVPIPAWAKAAIDVWAVRRDHAKLQDDVQVDDAPPGHSAGCGYSGQESDDPLATPACGRGRDEDASEDVQQLSGDKELFGPVFCPVAKGGRPIPGRQMSTQAIWDVVTHYARLAELPAVAPHDLRRTFAKLAHKGRAPLEQIQISLGHSSIQTTERYLGVHQDLGTAPCDVLGIRG